MITGQPSGRVHIVGVGMAGLAAALACSRHNIPVVMYDASRRPGGRLYSWHDRLLDRVLDNGIHWVFSGQKPIWDFVDEVGSADQFHGPVNATFDFVDLDARASWSLRPNRGPIPWWILTVGRNVPGTRLRDVRSLARLLASSAHERVSDCIDPSSESLRRFWLPFTIAALNTAPNSASAQALRGVLIAMLAKGEAGLRIRFPRTSLRESFVEPALSLLRERGVTIKLGSRLRGVELTEDRARNLHFADGSVPLQQGDCAVLAVSSSQLIQLVPGIETPVESNPIVTVHYRIDELHGAPAEVTCLIDNQPLWVQTRNGIASVTVGAAHEFTSESADRIARLVWAMISRHLRVESVEPPPYRVVKERHGVFAHTPENIARRCTVSTAWKNVFVAGDWVQTGMSATIESAIVAGNLAAEAALQYRPSDA